MLPSPDASPAPEGPGVDAFPLARARAARLVHRSSVGSTNDELVRLASAEASAWPQLALLVADHQVAGKGRLGRVWTAPAGTSLIASVVVRPRVPVESLTWLSLLAGLAMTGALRSLGAAAELKWPNDVRIAERKVCGILAELLPDLSGAVIGSGVNVAIAADDLPVDTATSLRVEGVAASRDDVLAAYLERLAALLVRFEAAHGDAEASGVRAEVEGACDTMGRSVRVLLPDGTQEVGTATGIDADGRLVLERDGRRALAVSAGEVTHLRY